MFTVECFSFLLQIAQLVNSNIISSFKGHSKILSHSTSKIFRQFNAELCLAHVFLLMLADSSALQFTDRLLGISDSAICVVCFEYLHLFVLVGAVKLMPVRKLPL